MVQLVIPFFLTLVSSICFANIDSRIGEHEFEVYNGPESPDFKYDSYQNKYIFVDDDLADTYVHENISLELNNLESFLNSELPAGLLCPDVAYKNKYKYIKYLFRLQVLSYLFQGMRETEYFSKKSGFKNSCSIDWKKFINKCKPKSDDMKFFKVNSNIAFNNLDPVLVSLKDMRGKYKNKWVTNFNKNNFQDLSHYRLASYCKTHSCDTTNIKSVEEVFSRICEDDQAEFLKICSEDDELKGVSYVPEIYNLISRSTGINVIDDDGKASGCLKRFIEQNTNKEQKSGRLINLFKVLYEHNLETNPNVPQGRLYTLGAIKEFTDKGLSTLFTIKKEIKKSKQSSKPRKIVELVNPEFEKIVLPKIVKKVKKQIKKKTVKKKKIFKEKISSFLLTSKFRKKFKLKTVEVDMVKFKYDYVFTLSQTKKLRPQILHFASVESLKSMSKLDKLGSVKSPIPLRFIKFLIDNKIHQHLFNIINVIGNEFFIINDIDEKIQNVDKISILNDVSTNYKWKMMILRP